MDKASRETVDLDGLALKIFSKYLKFLQGKVVDKPTTAATINKRPNPPTNINMPGPSSGNFNDNPASNLEDLTSQSVSVHMSEFPIESSAQV